MKKTAAILVLLLAVALPAAAQTFLALSDIHFDPFADPALVTRLESADVAQWPAILGSSGSQALSTYGSDINDALMRSALGEMKKQLASPAFVLISGDFLAHDFQQTYQKYATDKSQTAYTAFVTKTIAYVTGVIRKTYPGVAVYPVLGNNDSDCGDYAVAPDSVFLANVRDIWKPLVRSRSFDRRFATGGYYHADVPALKNVRIIALNTNFFSTKYTNPCGTAGADPGARQLEWLDAELDLARDEGKHVWLLFHIPPGIDVYDSEEWGGSCPNVKAQTFWKDQYQQPYLAIAAAHRDTILGSFAGHTHQDEFRFAAGDFIHITPSVSPVFGNNPAFEIVDVTRRGEVAGYVAHHLPNVTPPWSREYSFDTAYAKPGYNAATLTELEAAIGSDVATRTKYFDYYSSGVAKPSATALAAWRGYWCGLRQLTGAAFATCYCAP